MKSGLSTQVGLQPCPPALHLASFGTDLTPRYRAIVRDAATGEEAVVYGKVRALLLLSFIQSIALQTASDALEYGVEEVYQVLIDRGRIAVRPTEHSGSPIVL
mgnify:CR=1 FL=1